MQKREMTDFGIYRFSRHPQYLGWIIWSYGMLYLPGPNIRLCYGLSNSLPWLLSTMLILGVAMLEELKMIRRYGEKYQAYRIRTPFLIPLPQIVLSIFGFPLRFLFRKNFPERKREIIAVLGFYTIFCMGISVFYSGLVALPEKKRAISAQRIPELIQIMKEATNYGDKRRAAGELEQMGEPAVEPLIVLLEDEHPNVRAYAAAALGSIQSERSVAPLIARLRDPDAYVRRTAAGSLGQLGSEQAIQPLVAALQDRDGGIATYAAQALGQIKHPAVIPPLINALDDTNGLVTRAAVLALGETGASEAIEPILSCYARMPDCPYDAIGTALWKLKSEQAADAWISGVTKGSWWYSRVSCITALGKNKLEKGLPALQEALEDTSNEVRRAAVLALMEFRSGQTAATLQKALKDKDLEVRIYAQEALKRIKSADKK